MNDVAETGVERIQEYNNILTKYETENQFVLQIVNENRKNCASVTKYSLKNNFQVSRFSVSLTLCFKFYINY